MGGVPNASRAERPTSPEALGCTVQKWKSAAMGASGTAEPSVDEVDLEREIRAAWATLLDRSDAIADDITLTLLGRDNRFYDAREPALRAEIRSSTREHIRRGIRTMAGLAENNQRAIYLWRETGRRRARQACRWSTC